ncbi:hypothetical protein [Lacticaseibacillus chiayiensis]|uniref:Uncharacterized protein n=1 Tax=Lacticaseibacillus chiayiensis TaxID=2100821 RepID=A0ABY6H543_9LACO|nr:hypothetical protein [Lacticaseibacillus chiayiensis]QVI34222.1 hypothetical protein KG086_10550 [Lacticaseibacillus chiayiensis]UYN56000.1 hypothetical protein OFW50_11020 [Lacticaseibacillus chiayiensis]
MTMEGHSIRFVKKKSKERSSHIPVRIANPRLSLFSMDEIKLLTSLLSLKTNKAARNAIDKA